MPESKRTKYIVILLGILLCFAFIFDIFLGSVYIPPSEILNILLGNPVAKSSWATIVTEFRIPKAVTALLAGSALSVCGLLMQTFFRNPLAGPFVLGISSGASLGVALVILTAGAVGIDIILLDKLAGKIGTTIAAGVGAGAVLLIIAIVARKIASNVTLLILGLMLGHLIGAFESILKFFSTAESLQGYVLWGLGNFGGVVWNDLFVMIPLIVTGLILSFLISKQLNALLLGDNYATSMGVNIRLVRLLIIIGGGILGGVITAFCGPIAFLGIAVPHLTRNLLNESDHKILIPAVCIVGGLLALVCDIISQLPGTDQTLPINAVTSIIGAPVVIWIIISQRNLKASFT